MLSKIYSIHENAFQIVIYHSCIVIIFLFFSISMKILPKSWRIWNLLTVTSRGIWMKSWTMCCAPQWMMNLDSGKYLKISSRKRNCQNSKPSQMKRNPRRKKENGGWDNQSNAVSNVISITNSLAQIMACWRQAIIWANAGLLSIGPLGTNLVKFWSKF